MNNNQTEEFFTWDEKNYTEHQTKSENSGVKDAAVTINVIKNVSNKKSGKGISGIYKIINKINGKYYVGSSTNIYNRWRSHKSALLRGVHSNVKLQNAWNKSGKENFDFIIVERVPTDKLLEIEQLYLDECKLTPTNNYVISYCSSSPMLGSRWSEERKKHHSKLVTGNKNPNFNNHKLSGKNHPRFDTKIYTWKNEMTNESFTGHRWDFKKKYSVSKDTDVGLVSGRYKVTKKGWRLVQRFTKSQ
jgi:group I intron endonuclease